MRRYVFVADPKLEEQEFPGLVEAVQNVLAAGEHQCILQEGHDNIENSGDTIENLERLILPFKRTVTSWFLGVNDMAALSLTSALIRSYPLGMSTQSFPYNHRDAQRNDLQIFYTPPSFEPVYVVLSDDPYITATQELACLKFSFEELSERRLLLPTSTKGLFEVDVEQIIEDAKTSYVYLAYTSGCLYATGAPPHTRPPHSRANSDLTARSNKNQTGLVNLKPRITLSMSFEMN